MVPPHPIATRHRSLLVHPTLQSRLTKSVNVLSAGMLPHSTWPNLLAPDRAVAASAAVLQRLTGRTSPDIIFVASCLWCASRCESLLRAAPLSANAVCQSLGEDPTVAMVTP